MPSIIATFPAIARTIQTVTIGESQYRLGLTWRERTASWYLDLAALDGTPLALGVRLSAGWAPLAGLLIEDGPSGGMLYVRGLDGYARADLGDGLRLLWYTDAEIEAARAADDDAPIIVIAP